MIESKKQKGDGKCQGKIGQFSVRIESKKKEIRGGDAVRKEGK